MSVDYERRAEIAENQLKNIREALSEWEKAMGANDNWRVCSLSNRILVNAGLKKLNECEIYT